MNPKNFSYVFRFKLRWPVNSCSTAVFSLNIAQQMDRKAHCNQRLQSHYWMYRQWTLTL